MQVFGTSSAGCFAVVNVSAASSKGAIVTFPAGGEATIPTENRSSGILVTNVSLDQSDAIVHLKCFDDAIYTYTFGSNVGNGAVTFLGIMGPGRTASGASAGKPDGGVFKAMLSTYSSNRISKSLQEVTITLGGQGGALKGQLVSMAASVHNVELGLYSFQFNMAYPKVQGGA